MPSGPDSSPGRSELKGLGQVEYRLARDAVVREFQRGRLARVEVCDAQAELLRVARSLGRTTEADCPICGSAKLVHVLFAFGPRLPAGGRALGSERELGTLARANRDVCFYVVEVCTNCSWNYLVRMFNSASARRRGQVALVLGSAGEGTRERPPSPGR